MKLYQQGTTVWYSPVSKLKARVVATKLARLGFNAVPSFSRDLSSVKVIETSKAKVRKAIIHM